MRWNSASLRSRGGCASASSVFPSYMSSSDNFQSELLKILTSLRRAQHLNTAIIAYREAALKEVNSLVRRPLPSSNNDDDELLKSASTMTEGRQLSKQHKSSILAHSLRALEPEEAEALLVTIYVMSPKC